MRRGLVYSVAERGIDEDEGHMRLTFRYRARSWTVVARGPQKPAPRHVRLIIRRQRVPPLCRGPRWSAWRVDPRDLPASLCIFG